MRLKKGQARLIWPGISPGPTTLDAGYERPGEIKKDRKEQTDDRPGNRYQEFGDRTRRFVPICATPPKIKQGDTPHGHLESQRAR